MLWCTNKHVIANDVIFVSFHICAVYVPNVIEVILYVCKFVFDWFYDKFLPRIDSHPLEFYPETSNSVAQVFVCHGPPALTL